MLMYVKFHLQAVAEGVYRDLFMLKGSIQINFVYN